MHKTLDGWLKYITQCHKKNIALGLGRVSEVAKRLGCDKHSCPIVHVAGTNGKGTCVYALQAIYQQAGYRVGITISPHLLKVNERIVIDNQSVSHSDLMDAFFEIDKARSGIDLTYFEFFILAALFLFKQFKVDVIILEVGLGGRLDATNLVSSTIGVITSIGMDHQEYLGTTLDEIAREKAGIIKLGMQAVVLADVKASDVILAQAEQEKVKAYLLGRDFSLRQEEGIEGGGSEGESRLPMTSTRYVSSNLACAQQVVALLQPLLPIDRHDQDVAIQHLNVPGRLQQIQIPQSVLLDVAHNEDSVQVLSNALKQLPCAQSSHQKPKQPVIAIFSAMSSRSPELLIKPMQDLVDYWWLPEIENPNMHTPAVLCDILKKSGVQNCLEFASMDEVVEEIIRQDLDEAFFVVFGSFYTVSGFLGALAVKERGLYGK